jgi:hypothetical protein
MLHRNFANVKNERRISAVIAVTDRHVSDNKRYSIGYFVDTGNTLMAALEWDVFRRDQLMTFDHRDLKLITLTFSTVLILFYM